MKITTQYKNKSEDTAVDAEIESLLFDALKGFYAGETSLAEFTSTLENPNGIVSSDKVGPTIARDITRSAFIAVFLALLVIFAYIAIRFKGWTWGLGGVVSLAHTALIVIGFFSLFNGILPFNLDVDQTFIAAILTIIGYAINDNVVIFDRIREQKSLHPKDDFRTTVNTALNATLTRTVNTSVSTLLPMLAIAIFGGESIRGLAVALCLGILIGTYASIMIGTGRRALPRYPHRYLRFHHDRYPDYVRRHHAPRRQGSGRAQEEVNFTEYLKKRSGIPGPFFCESRRKC